MMSRRAAWCVEAVRIGTCTAMGACSITTVSQQQPPDSGAYPAGSLVDSGSSRFSSNGGEAPGDCTPDVTQCAGASAVQTCDANGRWLTPWSCATGTCSDGACSGFTTTGTSCSVTGPGLTDCGANSESCCTSLEVNSGTYYRTYDPLTAAGLAVAADGGPTGEADPATVSGFRLDKYLVTVGRFRQFVAAWNGGGSFTPATGSGKHTHLNEGMGLTATAGGYEPGWVATDDGNIAPTNANLVCGASGGAPNGLSTWTFAPGGQENLPIDCVTWYEAFAFCIWDGGFLPSETEWEYAAAGGSQQREYPWGTTDPARSNQYAIVPGYYTATLTGIAPVGTATLGAGRWGQLDLAGNVFEWNMDWYAAYVDPCVDCANATPASSRVTRGGGPGGDYFNAWASVSPARSGDNPSDRSYGNGFRCARTP